jgi:hypothetical protein
MFRTVSSIDPNSNYWIIAGSSTDVYAGASNTLVPVNDSDYAAWAANNTASPIASEAELADVLVNYGSQLPAWLFNATDTFIQPTPTTYTKGQLAAYSASARYNRASGGVIITSLSPSMFLSDPQSRNTINSAYDYLLANTSATIQWKMSDGTFITVNKNNVTTMANDVADYVHDCFACESTTLASINSGSITTLAAIDAAYAAITNVYP